MADTTDVWGFERTGPAWGAHMYYPKSGQDHLGLGSISSDRILPMLSPAINVQTIHPRYWSFYLFVLDEFWSRDLPRSTVAYRGFYRPREALFSMACHVCEADEHATFAATIVGSRKTSSMSAQENFDPHTNYIKEGLGGYGLYYRSTMEAMGTLIVANPQNGFLFDAPTDVGRGIAQAYRDAISPTALWRNYFTGSLKDPVPREVLVEFARHGCLCQLPTATDFDLPLLQDLFTHAGADREPAARRGTLRLLLDVSATSQDDGITRDTFAQTIYFRTIGGDTYTPRPDIVNVARRWRLLQAREYFSFAFNRLLGWLVRRGQRESDDGLVAVPMREVWAWIDGALDENVFGAGELEVTSATLAAEFATVLASRVHVDGGVDDVWPRHGVFDEHQLYRQHRSENDSAETIPAMLGLLLLVHRRVGTHGRLAELGDDARMLALGGSDRIGMARFFGELNRHLMRGITLSGLARWLFHDYVIVQHERVATAKLPDDTFRLRRVGDSIRFSTQPAPAAFNDSRFTALSSAVADLGLVSSLAQPNRELTPAGRTLLESGDLPTGLLASAAAAYTSSGDTA